MCCKLFLYLHKCSVIPPLKFVHMLSPCEMLPLAIVIRIKSLSSCLQLSTCHTAPLSFMAGFFFLWLCERFNFFLFMCVPRLAGAEKKKKLYPDEAALAYIQLKLRRKTVAGKTNFVIQYLVCNKSIMVH